VANYRLSYETAPGRCAWCWEQLPTADSHAVVSATSGALQLHFHHRCWPQYRACSGLDDTTGREQVWTPARIEELRIRGGWSLIDFAKHLPCKVERLRRLLAGDETALTATLRRTLHGLALDSRFERAAPIDWADPRAFFASAGICAGPSSMPPATWAPLSPR
jgi:hypothetical protein